MSEEKKWSGRFTARVIASVALFAIIFVLECLYLQSRISRMDMSGPKVFEFMLIMQAFGFIPALALLPIAAILVVGMAYVPALILWWLTGPRAVAEKPSRRPAGPSSTGWRPRR